MDFIGGDEMEWMKWNGIWSEAEWNEDGMMVERERFFLENIKCQVTLIFTLYFLHKTANPRLVFRLIHILFFYSFLFLFLFLFIYLFIYFFLIQKETKIRLMEEKDFSPLASLQNFLEILWQSPLLRVAYDRFSSDVHSQ